MKHVIALVMLAFVMTGCQSRVWVTGKTGELEKRTIKATNALADDMTYEGAVVLVTTSSNNTDNAVLYPASYSTEELVKQVLVSRGFRVIEPRMVGSISSDTQQ